MGELEKLLKLTQRPLPPLPKIAKAILETLLLKTEREFFELISTNKELSSLILSIANLPQFRKNNPPVEDIRKALLILGDIFVRTLVLSFISTKIQKTTFNEFNFKLFWARAITNLCFSNILFDYIENYPSHLHISAYLMDFGIIVLYLIYPQGYLKVLKLKNLGKTTCEAEREVFGVDHAIIGAEYFENYTFPRRFILDILYHHRVSTLPEEIPDGILNDVKIIHLIDLGVGSYFSNEREKKFSEFKEFAHRNFNFTTSQAETFIETLPSWVNQFFEIFNYKEFLLIPYSKWLKEKNEKLKETIKKIEETKKEKEEIIKNYKNELTKLLKEKEYLIQQLSILEDKLRKTSILDPLTQLYNENFFKSRLKEELLRAKRYKRIVSILLIEIEKLTKLTESYGSKEEEKILKILAENISQKLRRVDIVAKLDHPERFAIILPETPMGGAMVVARKILKTVEKTFYNHYKIPKSAFITVITYDPSKLNPKTDPQVDAILKALIKGMEFLKEKKQKRILALVIDKELENAKD
ncbi:HDOD domain-containing protein [Thermodesulfobacterium hydrogeniphilum]|uniref:HDOD domain-containing protein n=1 Tax=Thermodesulfobacterium hydrogeniphilum TaxID=161156 RepID=UPI0005703139|nr:HDOD domain-containing protein [Thermodesulfobacterium hydrogeniphilum]